MVIVGAGAAGLGAARQLKQFGFDVIVLEARARIGGRVCTSDSLGHVDLGASIVTGLIGNPLDDLYKQLNMRGVEIKDTCPIFNRQTGQMIPERTEEKWQEVFDEALRQADKRGKIAKKTNRADESLGQIIDGAIPLPKDEKSLGMLDWYYANLEYACACDLTKLSLLHWDQDDSFAFEGSHLMLADGYSSMIDPLSDDINVITNQIVKSIEYSSAERPRTEGDINSTFYSSSSASISKSPSSLSHSNGKSSPSADAQSKNGATATASIFGFGPTLFAEPIAHTANGTHRSSASSSTANSGVKSGVRLITESGAVFEADYALVTLPLGVLKQDHLKFSPPLPQEKKQAISRLGFGLLNKIVLRFDTAFWSNQSPGGYGRSKRMSDVDHGWFGTVNNEPFLTRESRGFSYMFWNLHRFSGEPVLVALCSGKSAHSVEERPKSDVVDDACDILKAIFKLPERPEPVVAYVTQWSKQHFSRGSYSYVAKGSSGVDYDLLAAPVNDRVFFAGEATSRCHPATVAGAYGSGLREAARILRAAEGPHTHAESPKFKADISNSQFETAKNTKAAYLKAKRAAARGDVIPRTNSQGELASPESQQVIRKVKRGFVAVADGHHGRSEPFDPSQSPTATYPTPSSSTQNGLVRNTNKKPTSPGNIIGNMKKDSRGDILTGSGNRYPSRELARQAEQGTIGPPTPSFMPLPNPNLDTARLHHALVQFIISKLVEYFGYGTFTRREQVRDISKHIAHQVLATEPSELSEDLKTHLTNHVAEIIGFYHPTAVHSKRNQQGSSISWL